ncbi:MAG TPA: antibiotic biosynthesis monooxygenase, partial [Puia sp.]|nr:antibiotic biosynthesis monooxygenase [Puia sp.]
MIVRIWHGRTRTSDAEVYRKYVMDTGIPEYTTTEGNMGAQIWQRQEGEITHIWTVSWWKDLKSIQSFAGINPEKAKYYEEDEKY